MLGLTIKERCFGICFGLLLCLDIALTAYPSSFFYGYVTKLLLLSVLLIFFLSRDHALQPLEKGLLILGLLSFFAGEILVVYDVNWSLLVYGLLFIIVAKLAYSLAFLNRAAFDIDHMLPFLVFALLYSMAVLYFLYDLPGEVHLSAYLYLVLALLMLNSAFLRQDRVNSLSFWLIFSGAVLFLVSETILVFRPQMLPLSFGGVLTLFLYGLSQYCFTLGLIKQ
ncbi:lysoplasmalogenase family protein [Robertkochia aurantiaca]|uniref:lysoplasmalogenase family protein n=1 Tax=Robertkochia aurantiaca TaxID=2873700 RepID=UPI001CCAD2FB|nr:lysoplasmalogenase family protein [Robertkochia sp. 3YJGBD-33]